VYSIADTLFSDGFQISLYNSGGAGVITNGYVAFFSSVKYYWSLNRFVAETAIKAIKNEKTLEDFDKMADDFIMNLNISSN
jgi:hypothetical protein